MNTPRRLLRTLLFAMAASLWLLFAAPRPAAASWGYFSYRGGTVASAPTAVAWGDNWVHVFSVDPQGRLQFYTNLGFWRTFARGPRCITAPAVVERNRYALDVYVIGADHQLYHLAYSSLYQWTERWECLGGWCQYGVGATANWSAGTLDVFVIGSDRALYRRHATENLGAYTQVTWGGWQRIPSYCASAPAACMSGPDTCDVMVLDMNGGLWHWKSSLGWEGLGGTFVETPQVIARTGARLDVVGVDSERETWHRAYFDGGWNGWVHTNCFASYGAAICTPLSGRVDIFSTVDWVEEGGAIDHRTGVDWVGWGYVDEEPTPYYGAIPVGSSPTVACPYAGHTSIYFADQWGSLWEASWSE